MRICVTCEPYLLAVEVLIICWLQCYLEQTITSTPDDAIPPPLVEPAEITLQEAHHSRCEGLLVSIVGTCLTAPQGSGVWSIMDGTGFAQIMQSEHSLGADVVPVRCAMFTLNILLPCSLSCGGHVAYMSNALTATRRSRAALTRSRALCTLKVHKPSSLQRSAVQYDVHLRVATAFGPGR